MKKEGLRFNEGKTRYDLLPPFAMEQFAKVLTKGAEKYAVRNWENGMDWSKVTASLKRHIAAFERGEDFDKETGLHHMAHAMCNTSFLLEYYKIYPQGDDRPHNYLKQPKIGLDIDDVIADFFPAFAAYFDIKIPYDWEFSYSKDIMFKELSKLTNDQLNHFFLSIKPKVDPKEMRFTPSCYITSRSMPTPNITEKWIEQNGFPCVPVYQIGYNESKIEAAKNAGIDIFVDDKYETFIEMNNAGICCFLFDTEWNRKYDVGFKRLYDLNDLVS